MEALVGRDGLSPPTIRALSLGALIVKLSPYILMRLARIELAPMTWQVTMLP